MKGVKLHMGKLISCCGTMCSECRYYPAECLGCQKIEGRVFWLEYTGESICDIYNCCLNQKEYVHCGQCKELPCSRYGQEDPTKTQEENQEDYRKQMANLQEYREIETLISDFGKEDSKQGYKSLKVLEEKSRNT